MDKKVLLVADDEKMSRKIIARFLSESFEVLEAENGREVLEILEGHKVDALLLDIIMPELDGLEVLKRLRADRQYDMLAILVATSTKEKTEREALSLGADDIVSKPYDPLVIERRLGNILALKEGLRLKELWQQGNVQGVIKDKRDSLSQSLALIADNITKCTRVIKSNKDNFKLVDEVAAAIDEQAGSLKELLR